MWWHPTLIPALQRQRQANLGELEANLVCKASSEPYIYIETLSQKEKKRVLAISQRTERKMPRIV